MTELSKYFTWKEALTLPQWTTQHIPTVEERSNIQRTALVMDKIRDLLGKPIRVGCWIRPLLNHPGHPQHGEDYNEHVDGARKSAHKVGLAVDFSVKGMSCDAIREILEPKLKSLGIRMEKLPGSCWVHIDLKPAADERFRYFKP